MWQGRSSAILSATEAMPAIDAEHRDRRSVTEVRLAGALGLGIVGLGSAVAARSGAPLQWLTVAAWGGSIVVLGWPAIRQRAPVARTATVAVVVAAAIALTVAADRTWVAAPAALLAWSGVAHVMRIAWTTVLGAAVAILSLCGAVLAIGARRASDALAVLAYGLACLACATAATGRMWSRVRGLR